MTMTTLPAADEVTVSNPSQPQTHSQHSQLVELSAQNEQDEQEEEEDTLLFSCRCESAKAVSTLLSSLRQYMGQNSNKNSNDADRGRGSQLCTVFVTESAITFHVNGVARQSQASADMQASLFSEYYVWSEEITRIDEETREQTQDIVAGGEFCVNLTTVLECLNVLGTSNQERTKLCMSYDRQTCIFKLELEEHGILCTCAILGSLPDNNAFDDDDDGSNVDGDGTGVNNTSIGTAFRRDKIAARAILKSDFLKDAIDELFELKAAGASCCTVGISSDRIELGAVGHSGECLVYLPKTPEVFVSLECDPQGQSYTFSYPLNTFLQGMRGLDIAHETCLSINCRGVLAVQHQVLDLVCVCVCFFFNFRLHHSHPSLRLQQCLTLDVLNFYFVSYFIRSVLDNLTLLILSWVHWKRM